MGNPGDVPGPAGQVNPVLVSLNDVQHQTLTAVEALAQSVAELDARLQQLSAASAASAAQLGHEIAGLHDYLQNLSGAIALDEHGVTLISLVQQIYDKVNSLADKVL